MPNKITMQLASEKQSKTQLKTTQNQERARAHFNATVGVQIWKRSAEGPLVNCADPYILPEVSSTNPRPESSQNLFHLFLTT